jgi:hypothetical protein
MRVARVLIFSSLTLLGRWAPRKWDPSSVQGGWVFLLLWSLFVEGYADLKRWIRSDRYYGGSSFARRKGARLSNVSAGGKSGGSSPVAYPCGCAWGEKSLNKNSAEQVCGLALLQRQVGAQA